MADPFSSWQVRGMERALAAAVARHRALSENVANADTPGYKRQDVRFWGELQRASEKLELARTHPGHLGRDAGTARPAVVRDATSGRADGNNVDIEYELASLAENGLWYQAVLQQLGARFALWRNVIEGRR